MNKKVLKTMIILCWVFLGAFALLKLIPQLASKFAIAINNEKVVGAGIFIDNRVWLQQIIHLCFTLLTYQFYLCACCKVWKLTLKQYGLALLFIIPNQVLTYFFPQVGSSIAFVIMFCLPCLYKADYRTVAIIFATHVLGQLAISFIRSEPLYMANVNTISQILMCIDQYVWLILYYLYSNLYKENKFMGTISPPLWNKMGKEVKQEIAAVDKKLEKCTDEKKRARLEAKREEYVEMLEQDSSEN